MDVLDALIRQSGRYRRNLLGTLRALPSRLEDRGAVAVEFALLLPVQVLMFAGVFGIGALIIEKMQLTYVVQGAAQVEAATGPLGTGAGAAWASTQLPPPAAFLHSAAPCGAQISGQWPIRLGIFPALTLSAWACWPWQPQPPA
jgi:TadE-like protein